MELVYLWVEDYKNIKKQGFNFSPRFRCEYDGETLTIDENDDYIPDFFGENINVTAIVGKNGSGKSSVLDLIDNGHYENPLISHYPMSDLDLIKITIYYSRVKNKLYIDKQGLKLTLNNKSSIIIDEQKPNESIQKILIHPTPSHSQEEYSLLLNFLTNIDVYFPFDIPQIIRLSIHDDYYSLLELIKNSDFEFDTHYDVFEENEDKRFKIFHILLLLAYLKNSKINFDIKASENYDYTILELESKINESLKTEISNFIKVIKDNLEEFSVNPNYYMDRNNISKYFFKIYREIIKRKHDEKLFDFKGKKVFSFDLYPKMSDGQYQLTYLFNKIYSDIDNENILLFIDEGENYLHPNWQKKYLSYIVKFIKDNFPDKKVHIILTTHSPFLLSDIPKQNIIFLDTYEDGKCKVLKHNEVMDKKQTFGANIHTLLSDSFFMEDGLIGEFAKNKINEIIDFHNIVKKEKHKKCLKKIYEKREKRFRQTQSIIGEAYLKQILENHLLEIDKLLFGRDRAKEKLKERLQKQLRELDE